MTRSPVAAAGEFADIELASLVQPLVAIDERFVGVTQLLVDNATSPHAKDIVFKDATTRKVFWRAGPDHDLHTLVDSDKKPTVHVAKKPGVSNVYSVFNADAVLERDAADDVSESALLLQVTFKLGWRTATESRATSVQVDFTDRTTGERCRLDMDGDWRSHSALFSLDRDSSSVRSPVARVFRPARAPRSDYCVDVALNVDAALVATICAVLDEELKREERVSIESPAKVLKSSKPFWFNI